MRMLLVCIALLAYAMPSAGNAQTRIAPDDPLFDYTETVLLDVNPNRARFTRETVDFFANNFAPGARINFATDASAARVGLYYREQAGDGHVALEIDGELVATDIGADLFREGLVWVPLF
ncbi:MAG: hypothetical protein AAFX85_05915, partial [Pseudomonadota bacterium]